MIISNTFRDNFITQKEFYKNFIAVLGKSKYKWKIKSSFMVGVDASSTVKGNKINILLNEFSKGGDYEALFQIQDNKTKEIKAGEQTKNADFDMLIDNVLGGKV